MRPASYRSFSQSVLAFRMAINCPGFKEVTFLRSRSHSSPHLHLWSHLERTRCKKQIQALLDQHQQQPWQNSFSSQVSLVYAFAGMRNNEITTTEGDDVTFYQSFNGLAFFGSLSVSLPWFPLRRTARLSSPQSSNFCASMGLMGWTSIGSTLALAEVLLRTSISSLSWSR